MWRLLKFGETVGTVDYIGLRSTRIRTLDRTILSVPNGQIASVGIETLSSATFWFHLRDRSSLRDDRGPDARRHRRCGRSSSRMTFTDSDSVRVRFFRLGSFSLDIEVFACVFAGDWGSFLTIQQDLLLQIMTRRTRRTAIAFPSQTLHIAEGRVPVQHAQAASDN